jgi:Spy/CpxP family protein refolding chaperone
MKRLVTGVGIAVVALAAGVAASQVQVGPGGQNRAGRESRPEVQRDLDEFHCGPARGPEPAQGIAQGRGPGGGRQGGVGRPGGRGPGGGGRGGFGGPDRALCALGLTDDQQAQISAIQKKTREEIEAVLTPEQREKLKAFRDGGRGPGNR